MDNSAILPLTIVLLIGLGYMARLYFRAQWRTAELLATLMAGSVLPATFSNIIRQQRESLLWTISMFAVLMVLGQLLAVCGTLIGMEWIQRWQMESTPRRLATIAYGWLMLPVIFGLCIFGCWVLGLKQNHNKTLVEAIGLGIALIVFLMPAHLLQRGPQAPDPHNPAPPQPPSP
jgi:uncharacterized membrane protein